LPDESRGGHFSKPLDRSSGQLILVSQQREKREALEDLEAMSAILSHAWLIVSSEVQASRPMVVEPGDGVAEGPLLVLDVRYVNKGDEYVHVSDSNFEIFTSVKSIDPSLERGEWIDTYGWDENGEWRAFGEEVAPGAEHRGLIITKLVEGEKPRFLEIKPSYGLGRADSESGPVLTVIQERG
jgi:hypothetical protein